jgi:ABC-2 type transport system permease protein
MLFSFFLSGHMFPLDMLPEPWIHLVGLFPLQYLAFFPAAVFLGKVSGRELVVGLIVQALWVLVFIVMSRVMFARGVRRYSGFGG